MTFIAIILLIIIVWLVFGETIKRALYGFLARKAEDSLRRSMGMPPRKEQKKNRRQRQENSSGRSAAYHATGRSDGPVIPKDYAEDVEYVEIKSYSEDTVIREDATGRQTVVESESQIEEAEVISITRDDHHRKDTPKDDTFR